MKIRSQLASDFFCSKRVNSAYSRKQGIQTKTPQSFVLCPFYFLSITKTSFCISENKKTSQFPVRLLVLWEQRDSNPRPSACKADALNQLSYAPSNLDCKYK